MNRKPILLTLAFALVSAFTYAQSAILKGQVTTSDNQPLEFVNVGIKGQSKGSTTDRFGYYEIKNVARGTYTVFASFVGLEKQEATVTIASGETTTLNFAVKESSTALSEVVVTDFSSNRFYSDSSFTVGKLPLRDLENPQVYNSISGKLLREQVVTNMNDAMKNATGVTRLWESTGRGGDGAEYYSMRGFSIQPTLVNGMPNVNNSALDPANIETIDVVKGPSGTLFGSAVISYGGLINITTKKPFDLFKGEVGFITGSFGMNRLTADMNVPLSEATAIRVNTAYQSQNTFQDAGNRSSFFIAPSFKFQASERLTFLINTEFLESQSVNAPMIFLNRNATLKFDNIAPFRANYERSFTGNDLGIEKLDVVEGGEGNDGSVPSVADPATDGGVAPPEANNSAATTSENSVAPPVDPGQETPSNSDPSNAAPATAAPNSATGDPSAPTTDPQGTPPADPGTPSSAGPGTSTSVDPGTGAGASQPSQPN